MQKIIPLNYLITITGRKLLLPFYHTVSNEQLPHIKYLYPAKTIAQFENELDFILKYFKPLSVDDLLFSVTKQQPIRRNSFLLTFDDGLKEMYDIVYPVLKRKGIPAVFFLNSGFVDNKDLFFRYKASLVLDTISQNNTTYNDKIEKIAHRTLNSFSEINSWIMSVTYRNRSVLDNLAEGIGLSYIDYLEQHRPYLTSMQISEMVTNGFTFGAHSVDHPFFSEISAKEQVFQANESMRFVMERFGNQNSYFSFPFFDDAVSGTVFREIYKGMEEYKPKLIFGSSGLKTDEFPFVYQRLSMEKAVGLGSGFIYSEYVKYMAKAILRKTYRKHPN